MKKTALIFAILFTCLFSSNGADKILRFKHITTDNGLPNNAVYSIIQDKYGFMWMGTLDGLCRYDGYEIKVYKGNTKAADQPINNRPIAMANDNDGNLYISFSLDDNRVCRYNFDSDNFTRIPVSQMNPEVMKLLRRNSEFTPKTAENETYRWDIRSKSLLQTNKTTGNTITYHTDSKTTWGISDDIVLSIYLDKQNVLWLGTDNGGISYADLNQPAFRFFPFQNEKNNVLKESIIRAIYQDNEKNLWVGSRNDGLVRFNANGDLQTIYRNKPGNSNSLLSNRIRKIYADSHGFLWIGTKDGLDKLNPKTNQFEHFIFDYSNDDPQTFVFSLLEDSEGILWAGTWRGLARYDRQHNTFVHYFSARNKPLTRIRDMMEDKEGNLWVATQKNGLSYIRKNHRDGHLYLTAKHYVNEPGNPNSISDDWLYCLCSDNEGRIWIGSGTGLNLFNPRTGSFTRFNNHSFIDKQAIHGILYENGSVWVSHQNGLTQIDCKTLNTRDYTKKYDFYGNEFSEDAFFHNPKTGELFFGGNKGFISFFPSQMVNPKKAPNVVLTNLKISNEKVIAGDTINGKVILKRPLYLTEKLELPWEDRNIQIQFAALYFPSAEVIKYSYRLKGFDTHATITDADARTAVYSNLPDGKYVFEVKAASPDGLWSEQPTLLHITILPPWWRSWWAYSIYFLCAAGLFTLVIKFILNRQKYRHDISIERLNAEKIKEMDELKTRMFTNISHEFRTPLTLIIDPIEKLLQDESLDEKTSYYHKLISKNAHRLMELVNQFLDLRKIEEGKLKLHTTHNDFILYIRSLAEYFELHARLNQIDFRLDTDCEHQLAVFDTEKMDKIFVNLLMNAFKNTQSGGSIHIKVQCAASNNPLTVSITDTGSGIPADQMSQLFEPFFQASNTAPASGTGIGLTMVRELVRLHGGEIEVESKEQEGTTFVVSLPVLDHSQHVTTKPVAHNRRLTDFEDITHSATPSASIRSEQLHILLVEDNTEVRSYLATELSDMGHITESLNGKEGLIAAKTIIPDLIISDVMMPEMDGFELCKEIKTSQETSHIPVILLTAQQSDEFKISGYETGADAYLTKPFNTTVLKARIINLTETRKKLRQLFDKSTGFNTGIIAANPVDKLFLQKSEQLILEHMENPDFDVEMLASKVNLSRTQLYRKVKSLTDKSVQEFITTIKLKKATELLLSGEYTITQISEMVGASDVGNFSRSFVKQYGLTPSAYKKSLLH